MSNLFVYVFKGEIDNSTSPFFHKYLILYKYIKLWELLKHLENM